MTYLDTLSIMEKDLESIKDEMLKTPVFTKEWDILAEKYKHKCVSIYSKDVSQKIMKTDANRIYNSQRL